MPVLQSACIIPYQGQSLLPTHNTETNASNNIVSNDINRTHIQLEVIVNNDAQCGKYFLLPALVPIKKYSIIQTMLILILLGECFY